MVDSSAIGLGVQNVQNVQKVPLSIVLKINGLSSRKSMFTSNINNLQINVKNDCQMALSAAARSV
jgi:hypothetical protein